MDKQQISEKAQELIDSGELTQWKKTPSYLLRERYEKDSPRLKDGTFEISKEIPPTNRK